MARKTREEGEEESECAFREAIWRCMDDGEEGN